MTLRGHSREVYALAWSPDGRRLASAGDDALVKVWDAVTGKELLTQEGAPRSGSPSAAQDDRRLAWSPDSQRLVAPGRGGTFRVWNAATGKEVFTLYGHNAPLVSVAWSSDGRRLAAAGTNPLVKLWDTLTGQEMCIIGVPRGTWSQQVDSLSWSPDGWQLAAWGGGKVTVWDVKPGSE
jgi:WD40 repeat protein